MIERISDMPPGTVGFRASGEVSADDYRSVLEPTLSEAVKSGEVRMLYVLDADLDMTGGAMAQDAKVGFGLGLSHHSAWKRSAVVTDSDWVRRAMHAFGWIFPGEFRLFTTAEIDDAKRWVGASD